MAAPGSVQEPTRRRRAEGVRRKDLRVQETRTCRRLSGRWFCSPGLCWCGRIGAGCSAASARQTLRRSRVSGRRDRFWRCCGRLLLAPCSVATSGTSRATAASSAPRWSPGTCSRARVRRWPALGYAEEEGAGQARQDTGTDLGRAERG